MTARDDLIVWMDLEMSGLDPERERILELAVLITDSELELVAEGPELVVHQEDHLLAQMDEWNRSHHGASGLTERVRASRISEAEAEEQVLAFLQQHCTPRSAPLAGNSIWQDRRFLGRYMPRLEGFMHYRVIDVSTLKELARRWHPDIHATAPRKGDQHRALADIRESIEELRHWRRVLFAPAG
jgi:oligoribonuclease